MWVGALDVIITGNVLEQYSFHVDAFSGNYEGLKDALLQACSFSTHDNLNFYKMIYSHNSSTGSTCWAKEASYCMFSLLKTCSNITASIADSILAMVTDVLASFYVILPLSMDGRSSIIITKPAILRSTFKLFKHLSSPLITKKKVLNQLSRKPFAIGKTESSTLTQASHIILILMREPQTITFTTKLNLLTLTTILLLSLTSQSLYQSVITVESKGTSLQNVLKLALNP